MGPSLPIRLPGTRLAGRGRTGRARTEPRSPRARRADHVPDSGAGGASARCNRGPRCNAVLRRPSSPPNAPGRKRSMVRNRATTHGPVTSSRSTMTRGLNRRTTATHSAFIRLTNRTSDVWSSIATPWEGWRSPCVWGEPAQVVVEQMGRDVAHRPAGGRPLPVRRLEATQEGDQLRVERANRSTRNGDSSDEATRVGSARAECCLFPRQGAR